MPPSQGSLDFLRSVCRIYRTCRSTVTFRDVSAPISAPLKTMGVGGSHPSFVQPLITDFDKTEHQNFSKIHQKPAIERPPSDQSNHLDFTFLISPCGIQLFHFMFIFKPEWSTSIFPQQKHLFLSRVPTRQRYQLPVQTSDCWKLQVERSTILLLCIVILQISSLIFF